MSGRAVIAAGALLCLAGCEESIVVGRGAVPVWDKHGCAFILRQHDGGSAIVHLAPELNRDTCVSTRDLAAREVQP